MEKGVCDVAGISQCIKLFRDQYINTENALGEFKGFTDEFLRDECGMINRGLRSRLLAIHEEARMKIFSSAGALPSAEVAKKLLQQVLKEFKTLKEQFNEVTSKTGTKSTNIGNLSMHVVRVEQLLVTLHVYLDKKNSHENAST